MHDEEHIEAIDLKQLWSNARLMRDRGYHLIPIRPNSKRPAFNAWAQCCDRPPSDAELGAWAAGARNGPVGVGLALGAAVDGARLVAFDWDLDREEHHEKARAVEAELGIDMAPAKAGRRGWTVMFRLRGGDGASHDAPLRGAEPVADEAGTLHDQAGQLLARGRQTLLPPTLHCDTGRPYRWLPGRSLWPETNGKPTIVPATELPVVDLDQMLEVLSRHGFDTRNFTAEPQAAGAVLVGDFDELPSEDAEVLGAGLALREDLLGGLWRDGAKAAVFELRDIGASGSQRRHQLAYLMATAGFEFNEYVAALREWPHTVGRLPFYIDADLARGAAGSLRRSWASAFKREAKAEAERAAVEERGAALAGAMADEADGAPDELDALRAERRAALFPSILPSEVAREEPDDEATLVAGLVAHGKSTVFYGPSHVGKSTIVHAFAEAIATGAAVDDLATDRCGVWWCALEDATGTRRRHRLAQALAGGEIPITIFDGGRHTFPSVNVPEKEIVAVADRVVATMDRDAEALGIRFKVAVFDSWLELLNGEIDDNNPTAMRIGLRLMKALERRGVAVFLIAHTGKNTEVGPRGAKALVDFASTVLEVQEGKILVKKNRVGRVPKETTFGFALVDTPLPWATDPKPVAPGDFEGLPRVVWRGRTSDKRSGRRGPVGRVKLPAPGTLGDEALRALERSGSLDLRGVVAAVVEDRKSRGVDIDETKAGVRRLSKSVDQALARGREAGWSELRDGVWWAASNALGMALAAVDAAEGGTDADEPVLSVLNLSSANE